jgi:rod shape-determining protein MreD
MSGADRAPVIRPRPTVASRLDQAARASVPAFCTLMLMLAATAPWGLPMQATLLPAVAVGSVWFWSLSRPAAFPPALVFALGIVLDLLGYLPLGTGVVTLLAVHGIAARCRGRLASQPFRVIWPAYAAVAIGTSLGGWAIASGLQWRWLPFSPALFQCALTVAVYPGLSGLFARADRTIADPARG